MGANTDLIYDIKRKMLAKYPRFGSEVAVANIEFRDDLPFSTAATDGKNIYVDPNYFESLSENDKLFTIAHEIMHIKFMHMFRLMDKDGKRRNLELWNIATDAIINANLERDGFTIKEGYVNMPEALNYSAEEFYQKLLEEQEKKQNEQQNKQRNEQQSEQQNEQQSEQQSEQQNKQQSEQQNEQQNERQSEKQNKQQSEQQNEQQNERQNKQNQSKENENNQEQGDEDNQEPNNKQSKQQDNNHGDDHSMWKKAFEQQQQQKNEAKEQEQEKEQGQGQEQTGKEQTDMNLDEREEFADNRKEKIEKFKHRSEKTKKDIRSTKDEAIKLENIGESKEEIDWKVLIRREIEKTETIWSQRHSIAENNYAYRLEENDIEDDAETEIMIDVSGSVSLELVKAFLRQIKPLLKQSKLRVGCFDVNFFDFIDIKNMKDIDNFTIPKGAGGYTDLDLPVRCFTKKREINKIVFTDGYPSYGNMPKDDLKKENIIWLVYGNKDFVPCCGKVINITERQLAQLQLIDKESFMDDISR